MSARNRELLALIPVALLAAAGFASVLITQADEIDNLSLTYGAYFLGICLVGHLFLRWRLPYADPYLFPLCALLAALGLVIIYSLDEGFALNQASVFALGMVVLIATVIFLRDYHVLERYRYVIAAAAILLLLAPRIPGLGQQVNGAYLGVGIGPINFQPTELAKIGIVVFLASYLAENRELLSVAARRFLGLTIPPLKHFGPLLVVWGAAMVLLVFIRDLGSSLMFFGAFLVLLYIATQRFSYVLIGVVMFAVGLAFFAETVGHVQDRFDIWLDPFVRGAPDGAYQIQQSLFAQADGGLFGQGLGEALIKFPGPFFPAEICNEANLQFPECGSILPAPHTDFIFAVIVNELGVFGGCAVILTYGLIAARGFKIAVMAPDGFSKLLAAGLSAVFALQAFVIIGGVVKAIPLTGVTLPFISFGGSSVIANMILLALLLLISDRARRPQREGRGGVITDEPSGVFPTLEEGRA
ncbi:FtsW/RodA/SpoVE family cell cycle protein [Thermoleophilia bacterium SCSIO 60948]|nr:FtsW/RodA/SpoVE family cell cycle protein [Thermoleophilia bacterium SCSIO 60948]